MQNFINHGARRNTTAAGFVSSLVLTATLGSTIFPANTATAANHREAPITALDHKADITDFFAFVSYDDPDKVTLILDVDPLLEPSNGPNYHPFDPEILYQIKIDNDFDAVEDISFEFRFSRPESRLPGVFTGFVGALNGVPEPANAPAPQFGGLVVPPAITALEGPGSEGFNLRQTYSVTMVEGHGRNSRRIVLAEDLIAVPANVGPRTMPNYPDLVQQGVYQLDNNVQVFAGTADDPFWIDLGAVFDSFNIRSAAGGPAPGVLNDSQDLTDDLNFAADDVSGFNVNAIAIEVPITMLTQDGQKHEATDPLATIGTWGTTSRPRIKILPIRPGNKPLTSRSTAQIQRMANPLINELIIGTAYKDKFSMSQPKDDSQFADFFLDPVLARVLNAVYEALFGPDILPVPDTPRLDLLPLVKYMPPIAASGTPEGPIADLLRLNTGIPATPMEQRSRLGLLGGDQAGFPNGRRVSDDVTDITARVVAGVLAGPQFNIFPNNRIGDGVNANDVDYLETFPYLAYAHSGRDSRHVDPGEIGCLGTCPID